MDNLLAFAAGALVAWYVLGRRQSMAAPAAAVADLGDDDDGPGGFDVGSLTGGGQFGAVVPSGASGAAGGGSCCGGCGGK